MSRPFGNGLDLLSQVMYMHLQQLAGLLRRAIVALYGFGLQRVALPLVERDWLRPGAFVARLGSYQEVALDVITRAGKVIVDNWHYVSPRIPELKMLIQEGRFGFEDVHAEWPHIVVGRRPGRQSSDEVIVYIALGIWGEYAAILPEVYRRALALGLAQRLSPNHET
jgi:ornithine cyclodeaminase/alanine dehydrogenase-like protein (mu-crystallin family)